uniref:Uncharacterized protein n=1 Tax=Globisporangium ultimum (strain ATCC 200006 / CBS 805.95 / DAOM BR144) TaxID=431595 RepID=K3WIW8_GLOUD
MAATMHERKDEGRAGVPPLVQLCLRAIAIRLKHFFNASHHAALLEALTDVEKALLLPYDLSRLDLLGVEAPPSVELRVPAQANPFPQRKEWVGNGDSVSPETFQNSDNTQEKQDHSDWAGQKLFTLDRLNQYRSPITNTGCGAIARSTVLQVLDLSNQTSTIVKSKRMDNEIGCNGSLAIALALESNKSLTQLSLSGNPIGAQGGRALAAMLQKNHTLKHLELESTKVGEAADDLIDAYSNSHSFELDIFIGYHDDTLLCFSLVSFGFLLSACFDLLELPNSGFQR